MYKQSFSTGQIQSARPWEKHAGSCWKCMTWETHGQRDHQLCYYAMSLALFILHGYHCTCKSLTNMYLRPFRSFGFPFTVLNWDGETMGFYYDIYVKDKSWNHVKESFALGILVFQTSSTIFELLKELGSTGYLLHKKYTRQILHQGKAWQNQRQIRISASQTPTWSAWQTQVWQKVTSTAV
jgi:hypothetical protein